MTQRQIEQFAPVGRLEEFERVVRLWESACHRRPSLLVISGQAGVGKTTVMQGLFRYLAATDDPGGYWPRELGDSGRPTTIVPEIPERTLRATPPLPWLWLGVRWRKTDMSESAPEEIAFDLVRRQLQWHLAGLLHKQRVRKANRELLKATVAAVAGFAFPGTGHVVNAIQAATAEGMSFYDEIGAILSRFSAGREEREAVSLQDILARDRESMATAAVQALGAIAGSSGPSAETPVILFVDAAQRADETTLAVVNALLRAAWEGGWRLLTVVACRDGALNAKDRDPNEVGLGPFIRRAAFKPERLRVPSLEVPTLKRLALKQIPGLGDQAADVLVRRCGGNLNLLNDFLGAIKERRGWLDETGRLRVPLSKLATLPDSEEELARTRLHAIDPDVATALDYASLQGVEFHELIVACIASKALGPIGGLLQDADSSVGVTRTLPHHFLGLDCEFRRPVFWRICREDIEALVGDCSPLLRRLAVAMRDVLRDASPTDLTRRERGLMAGRLLELRDEARLKGAEWDRLMASLELDLAETRLDIGDAASAEALTAGALPRLKGPARIRAHRVLTEAAHMRGSRKEHRARLDAWAEDPAARGVELLLRQSSLSLESGAPVRAVAQAEEAVAVAGADRFVACTAEGYLAHAQWARGESASALQTLANVERRRLPDPHGLLAVGIQHTAALALHDLERNLQAMDQARRCATRYEAQGRLEAQVIATVDLGDAMWGAGDLQGARATLVDAHRLAIDANLPQAIDVASMCLANVYAAEGNFDDALALYEAGIAHARRIRHRWDELYGEVYRWLACAERGVGGSAEVLVGLANRASRASYHYLRSLALAYSAVAAYTEDEASAAEALDTALSKTPRQVPPGPAAHFAALAILLANGDDTLLELKAPFLEQLGRCEGLKGRPAMAVNAIALLRDRGLLSNVEGEFARRWEARFAWYVNHPRDTEAQTDDVRLLKCDYRLCEARCCYDGVYLRDDDIRRINNALKRDRDRTHFADVPDDWLVTGDWDGESSPKTAVRPHTYSSPDFPAHFTPTRCVFAAEDGACTLQTFAEKQGEEEWAYKPLGCSLHPLRTKPKPTVTSPGERDQRYVDLEYPGYADFTPCGQSRADGKPWAELLRGELTACRRKLGATEKRPPED